MKPYIKFFNEEDIYKKEFKEEVFDKNKYLKWKRKNVSYRGMKEVGVHNEYHGSVMGAGLYTASLSNKAMAKQYGRVYFVVNGVPKKPKIVRSLNDWELFEQDIISKWCKSKGINYDRRVFEKKTEIGKEIQKLGYDGVIIQGREMVNYKPKDVLYFDSEEEVIDYYINEIQ
jgi:hypothetical protein